MSLDGSLSGGFKQKRKAVVRRLASFEVLDKVSQGSKFIVVGDDFTENQVPQGFTLLDLRHRGESFRALVPQSLLYYMANPGEGDPDGALEEIADFYSDSEDFEDEKISEGVTSVQQSNWTSMARESYHTYLINCLVRNKSSGDDNDDEYTPEFNPDVVKKLDLDDSFVSQRVKAIAALALGKTTNQVKKHEVKDVLKHVTVGETTIVEKIGNAEFREITQMRFKPLPAFHRKNMRCLADSHYYLRDEYKNGGDKNWDYDLRTMTKTKKVDVNQAVLDSKISDLENEIVDYRKKRHGGVVGRHDAQLIRQYANMSYIAPENPRAQLDIMPPEKVQGDEK